MDTFGHREKGTSGGRRPFGWVVNSRKPNNPTNQHRGCTLLWVLGAVRTKSPGLAERERERVAPLPAQPQPVEAGRVRSAVECPPCLRKATDTKPIQTRGHRARACVPRWASGNRAASIHRGSPPIAVADGLPTARAEGRTRGDPAVEFE